MLDDRSVESTPLEVTCRNVLAVIAEVRLLHEAARLLIAGEKLSAVDNYLASGQDCNRKEVKAALALLDKDLKPKFNQLRRRAAECRATLDEWDSSNWLLAQTFIGVTTSYKYDPDGSLWVKMDGQMDNVRLLDQLATVREVDLYKTWAPFCDVSTLLKRIDIVEMLVHLNTSLPGSTRDCVLHAYGCDAVLEANCILIQGRSVDHWEGVDIPQVSGWRHARMDIRAFKVKIEVLSPTSASTSIVSNIDPKAPLPRPLVNFFIRRVVGMFLYCLREAAKGIPVDVNNELRERILQDKEFYQDWLVPRIERFYRKKCWPFDDVLQRGGDSQETAGANVSSPDTTEVVSGACCLPFRMKACRRIKSSLALIRSSPRHIDTTSEVPQPQVIALDIDQRLLEKWQARREARTAGQISRRMPPPRLLVSLLAALCASFIHWLCFSDEKEAYRFRAFAAMAFAACVVLVCTTWF